MIKKYWKKILYILCWSAGLFCATFSGIFRGEIDFNMSVLSYKDIYDKYQLPLALAVALFLADLAYSTLLDNKIIQRERISLIIILLGFVVVGVILEANPEFQNMSIFWTGLIWISLTLLKVIHTPNVPKKDSQRQTWRVINEN